MTSKAFCATCPHRTASRAKSGKDFCEFFHIRPTCACLVREFPVHVGPDTDTDTSGPTWSCPDVGSRVDAGAVRAAFA